MKIVLLKISIFFLLSHTTNILATLGVNFAQANAVQVQSDNKIIVAGTITINNLKQLMLARYTPFGTIDTSFGYNGYVATPVGVNASANDIMLLSDDQALLVGTSQSLGQSTFTIARYNRDGILDTTFNNTGVVTQFIGANASGNGVLLNSDGNYLIGGTSVIGGAPIMTVACYNTNGKIDTSFGNSGTAIKRIFSSAGSNAIVSQSSGKIIAVGFTITASNTRQFGLVRFNTDGSVDTTFGTTGTITTSIGSNACAYAAAVQSNNYIIAAGESNGKFALTRYAVNGSLDTTFGSSGIVTTSIGTSAQINDVIIQSNGRIIAVGFSDNGIALARYNTNGSLDTTFGSSGIVTTLLGSYASANSVALQSNGQIVIAGASDNGAIVLRYNSNGSLDASFGVNGIVNFPNDYNAPDIFGISDVNIAEDANISYSKLNLNNSLLNSDISVNAAISDTKLASIVNPGKVLNTATTATSLDVPGAIVSRDTLGNFSANVISGDLAGNVIGSASQNVLKTGDAMLGSLVLPSGSSVNPSLQFAGNANVGLSATSNGLTFSTNGIGRLAIDDNGSVTINLPNGSEPGLSVASSVDINGDLVNSGNITFNTNDLPLNSLGTTQGSRVKVFSGVANTGLSGQVVIDYSDAGFLNPPVICANSITGSLVLLSINFITNASATITSPANINVPFNYIAMGI